MPYAVLIGAGYLAYRYIARSTVGNFLKEIPANVEEKKEEIKSREVADWWDRTPAGKALKGDWAGAAAGLTTPGMIWNLLN